MSAIAEYIQRLHKTTPRVYERDIVPFRCPCAYETLKGVRAVIFDIYGTMVNYWRPGFEDKNRRDELLQQAFADVADMFGMNDALSGINPHDPPARTLKDFYNGLLALAHQKSADKNVEFSEIRVEEVWTVIAMILKRNGYDVNAHLPSGVPASVSASDFAKYLAATYNYFGMGRTLYPGVTSALKKLKNENIVLGILSDAQFYTPIDLTLYLRDQSDGKVDDYNDLFDAGLSFFSYEHGFVKPAETLFRRLADALNRHHITPAQTVFVGNDFNADIRPAAAAGMRTALFCGDDKMVFGKDENIGDIVPDIVFEDWELLPQLISFYGEEG